MKRPWSQQEFPVLAEWLAANETPLTLVVEASNRPRRYDPLCCGEKIPLLVVPLPAIQRYRDVARRCVLGQCCGCTKASWRRLGRIS